MSIEDKQNYLRTEILDKGYDADDFINFLIEKRGEDASNIEIWEYEDLKAVVKEYLYTHSPLENQYDYNQNENDYNQDYNNNDNNNYDNQDYNNNYDQNNYDNQDYNNNNNDNYDGEYERHLREEEQERQRREEEAEEERMRVKREQQYREQEEERIRLQQQQEEEEREKEKLRLQKEAEAEEERMRIKREQQYEEEERMRRQQQEEEEERYRRQQQEEEEERMRVLKQQEEEEEKARIRREQEEEAKKQKILEDERLKKQREKDQENLWKKNTPETVFGNMRKYSNNQNRPMDGNQGMAMNKQNQNRPNMPMNNNRGRPNMPQNRPNMPQNRQGMPMNNNQGRPMPQKQIRKNSNYDNDDQEENENEDEDDEKTRQMKLQQQKKQQIERSKILAQQRAQQSNMFGVNRRDLPTQQGANRGQTKARFPDLFAENADTTASELTPLGKFSSAAVKISDPQRVAGGVFSKGYTKVSVNCTNLNTTVTKKLEDFDWLRQELVKFYPGSIIPVLSVTKPEKKITDEYIDKRIRKLERFMALVLTDPLIRRSNIVYEFLTIDDEKLFNNKKNQYTKEKAPSNLQEIKTISGKTRVNISKERDVYFDTIKEYSNNAEASINNLCNNLRSLHQELNNVSTRLETIGKIFDELFENSNKSSDNKLNTQAYNLLSKIMKDWSYTTKELSKVTQNEIKENFSFNRLRCAPMKDYINKIESKCKVYSKIHEQLMAKKEELFGVKNIYKWGVDPNIVNSVDQSLVFSDKQEAFDIMLYRESESLKKIKEDYGYYLNMIICEYDRLRIVDGNNNMKAANNFFKKFYSSIGELHKYAMEALRNGVQALGIRGPPQGQKGKPGQKPDGSGGK